MQSAINAWSIPKHVPFEQMFSDVKAAGFKGIELNLDTDGAHALTLEITSEKLSEIHSLSEKYDLPVVSISTSLWGGNMGLGTAAGLETSKNILSTQLRCANALGAKGILIVPGGISDEVSLLQAYDNCEKTLLSLRKEIEQSGVNVGVENVWNAFFTSPFDMVRFIDGLEIKGLGAYYDLGNTIAFSNTGDWVQILGSRIKNIHIKGYNRSSGVNSKGYWTDISKASVDWNKVFRLLKNTGYDGYITAEVGKTDPSQTDAEFYKTVCGEINSIIEHIN